MTTLRHGFGCELILEVQTDEFWQDITASILENVRKRLRSLVKFFDKTKRENIYTDFLDLIGEEREIELPGFDAGPRFLATPPGAVLAVGSWISLSYLLGSYFRHFGTFNKTYGTLGAAIALMVWLYWTGFAMLVGAELNAELAKISNEGKLQEKHKPPAVSRIDPAA